MVTDQTLSLCEVAVDLYELLVSDVEFRKSKDSTRCEAAMRRSMLHLQNTVREFDESGTKCTSRKAVCCRAPACADYLYRRNAVNLEQRFEEVGRARVPATWIGLISHQHTRSVGGAPLWPRRYATTTHIDALPGSWVADGSEAHLMSLRLLNNA